MHLVAWSYNHGPCCQGTTAIDELTLVRTHLPLVQSADECKNAITPTHATVRPKTHCHTLYFFHFVKERCLKNCQGLSAADPTIRTA